ncbi:MAG: hypothetical protein OEQ53_11305 [Saprospiraceae bacterium]|nr:hypothetical protein [Saprospiraceae bacterium]
MFRLILIGLGLVSLSCASEYGNPPAADFDLEGSDPQAMQIADEIMDAMGGRQVYDNTRILSWTFFDFRHLVWDKQSGDVRIDSPRDSTVYLLNMESGQGRVRVGSRELAGDSLRMMLDKGKGIWTNDSYWLLLPFKLKDSGVTLKYVREDTTQGGVASDVLQLTFSNVGLTPHNKYEVWVDKADHLIKQWSFYAKADAEEANSTWPWDNYQQIADLLISADRSDKKGPKNVQIFERVEDSVFSQWLKPSFIPI